MTEYIEAKAVLRPSRMNKLEAQYAQDLEAYKWRGEILWWRFEPIKIRLADGAFYTPDFGVVRSKTLMLEFHECKGFWRESARVRIKVAAESFPAKFVAVKLGKRGWEYEYF